MMLNSPDMACHLVMMAKALPEEVVGGMDILEFFAIGYAGVWGNLAQFLTNFF